MIRLIAILVLGSVSAMATSGARGSTITVSLSGPTSLTPASAIFDVFVSQGDLIPIDVMAIQLSVFGSDPLLTFPDFGRFTFTPDPLALTGWSGFGFDPIAGVDIFTPPTFFGPFLPLTTSPVDIGDLTVDLTGIPTNHPLTVSIGDAFMDLDDFRTDFFVLSPDPHVVVFDPGSVAFSVGSTVIPEPCGLAVWGIGMSCFAAGFLARRRRRKSI